MRSLLFARPRLIGLPLDRAKDGPDAGGRAPCRSFVKTAQQSAPCLHLTPEPHSQVLPEIAPVTGAESPVDDAFITPEQILLWCARASIFGHEVLQRLDLPQGVVDRTRRDLANTRLVQRAQHLLGGEPGQPRFVAGQRQIGVRQSRFAYCPAERRIGVLRGPVHGSQQAAG